MNKIKNLLIVEDEMILSKILEQKLNDEGFQVIASVTSGEEAIKLCQKIDPDCILMDIKLSGELDGIETATIIKQQKDIPIIYLTAYTDDEIIEKAKVTDPFGYLLKPFDIRDLKKTIEIALYKHKLENRLRQSEEKFRILFDNSPLGNVLYDENGIIINANTVFSEMLGFKKEDIVGKNIWSLIYEKETIQSIPGDLDGYIIETKVNQLNGEELWLKISISSISLPNYSEKYSLGVAEDITFKKQSEVLLQESESRLRKLVENLPAGAVYLEDDTFYFNLEAETITGYSVKEIKSLDDWFTNLYPDHTELVKSYYFKDKANGFKQPRVVEITRKDKQKRQVEFIAHLFSSGEVWIMIDITNKVKVEEELLRSRDQLKKLTEYLQSAREEERARIAREVHDDLGQTLTAIKMDIVSLQKNKSIKEQDYSEKLKGMLNAVNHSIRTIQRIGTELRPKLLDDLGLVSAIEWQAQEFQKRSGINCAINVLTEELNLSPDSNLTVFRIFQEALTNIARHSQASNVIITIYSADLNLILSIADDGIGIPESKLIASSSIGLIGMKERAEIVGAEVEIKTKKNKGTEIIVSVPIEKGEKN